jgi:hypothetical protein
VQKTCVNNIVDYLSKHPKNEKRDITRVCDDTSDYVAFVLSHSIPRAMTTNEIVATTKSDMTLQVLSHMIRSKSVSDVDRLVVKKAS